MPNKTSIIVQGTEVHIVSIDNSDFSAPDCNRVTINNITFPTEWLSINHRGFWLHCCLIWQIWSLWGWVISWFWTRKCTFNFFTDLPPNDPFDAKYTKQVCHLKRRTPISPDISERFYIFSLSNSHRSVESRLNTNWNIQTPSIDRELKPHGDRNG